MNVNIKEAVELSINEILDIFKNDKDTKNFVGEVRKTINFANNNKSDI